MAETHITERHRWDPIVRMTHWSIALAVLANAIFTEEGSGPHIWVGYGLAAILVLRLFWGLVGPAEARFSAFWPAPRKVLTHVRDIRQGVVTPHASHNPLGALMVYAIWACLLTIIATGIAMAGPPPWRAASNEGDSRAEMRVAGNEADNTSGAGRAQPGDGDEGAEGEEHDEGEEHEEGGEGAISEIHEVAANLLYVLILLHIAGVVFETRRSGKRVLVAMLPFKR